MIPKSFTEYFTSLDETGRMSVVKELSQMLIPESTTKVLEGIKPESHKVCCPSCTSYSISGNGKYKGVQRYVCRDCKKYFRDSTGSLTYNLKKGDLLPKYLYNMLLGYSIKRCSEETSICVQTSFDWRHKILNSFNELQPSSFGGIVESDDIFFLESEKGSRNITRKSRKRGSKATKRGISNEQVAVVITQDRKSSKEMVVVKKGRITKKSLEKVLGGRIENGATLCTDSHRSYTAFTKANGIDHKKFIANKGQRVKDKIYHVQNVNNTASRLRSWMKPFNGVATKYLQNYLNWFMVLEKIKNDNERLRIFGILAFAGLATYERWQLGGQSVVI
jgi:transposase-like protein